MCDCVLCLFQTKRIVVYLGRAKPERLVDEMMIELQVWYWQSLNLADFMIE